MSRILKRLLFGKPMFMSVYQDKYGNYYGGTIHHDSGKQCVDVVSHIDKPVYLGKVEVYIK